MLPPDERVRRVAPRARLDAAGVAAKVLGALHLGEDVERRPVVRVRLLRVPPLARDPVLRRAHVALVEPPAPLHARRCEQRHRLLNARLSRAVTNERAPLAVPENKAGDG